MRFATEIHPDLDGPLWQACGKGFCRGIGVFEVARSQEPEFLASSVESLLGILVFMFRRWGFSEQGDHCLPCQGPDSGTSLGIFKVHSMSTRIYT